MRLVFDHLSHISKSSKKHFYVLLSFLVPVHASAGSWGEEHALCTGGPDSISHSTWPSIYYQEQSPGTELRVASENMSMFPK